MRTARHGLRCNALLGQFLCPMNPLPLFSSLSLISPASFLSLGFLFLFLSFALLSACGLYVGLPSFSLCLCSRHSRALSCGSLYSVRRLFDRQRLKKLSHTK